MVTDTEITYTYGGATLGGGQSLLLDSASNGTQRDVFSSVDQGGGDFFVSYIFRVTGSVFTSLQARDSGPNINDDSISLVTTPGSEGNLGVVRARVANTDASSSAGSVVPDPTYFLVTQFTGWTSTNYSTVNVWLNPVESDQPPISISATITNATAGAGSDGFIGLYFRTSGIDAGTESFLIDDLRVGTDWASVTEVSIPEPSAASLAAGGVVALCALFNRRRRA